MVFLTFRGSLGSVLSVGVDGMLVVEDEFAVLEMASSKAVLVAEGMAELKVLMATSVKEDRGGVVVGVMVRLEIL